MNDGGRSIWELLLGWPSTRQKRIVKRLRQKLALSHAANERLRLENEVLAMAIQNTQSWVRASTATAEGIAKTLEGKR